jgi:hypothetical protein
MILDAHDRVAEYTAADIWGDKTLMDLVIDTAALTPDAEALVDPPNRAELMPGGPRPAARVPQPLHHHCRRGRRT